MHIHILGIGGTFMGSLAILASQLGITVSGSDQALYPPMSTQLDRLGIDVKIGYDPAHLTPRPDWVIIGNALSRGNALVECVLDRGLPYTSGPAFLAQRILANKWVLAVAGTHGKTTVSSMLAWILEYAGLAPGFLIGGIPRNFGCSANSSDGPLFVVEADEYDTAFFDKRSKFVHYCPRTLVINNLEYDHADIFADLQAIQKQFHHVVRTVPRSGRIIAPAQDRAVQAVLDMGYWSDVEYWHAVESVALLSDDGSQFQVRYPAHQAHTQSTVSWSQTGQHNVANALAAIAAARHAGVPPTVACAALGHFQGVKRRLEKVTEVNGITLYDDFAHHPTAIATTLAGLRAKLNKTTAGKTAALRVVIDLASNSMKMGVHKHLLANATQAASEVIWFKPDGLSWSLEEVIHHSAVPAQLMASTEAIVRYLQTTAKTGDHLVIMSNRGFDGIHSKLTQALKER